MMRSTLLSILFFTSLAIEAQAEVKSAVADYKAVISPVLELAISQEGQSELKFGDILSSALGPTDSTPKTIVVEVKSNTGERYQVSQKLAGPLENSQGNRIDLENLKFKSRSAGGTGNSVADLVPAADAAQTVFISDDAGTGEMIFIEYELTIPPTQPAGDYSSLLTYTVSSL